MSRLLRFAAYAVVAVILGMPSPTVPPGDDL